ncbi:6-phosphogluconolactonase [Spirilliplanes yamanashiensis]|uniref:6-phosphogluconolactonase n=1 Tax=Spirilliplanes yamanashiensis TaxID=42233 RepID=A0A8J3Y8P6_9ACTN|nr:6-phosphogluconolactonase [Spirilliplanes yamanashiensis]MDP9817079.1 6-phosphogluconolactonase [Spirilliplanes yamanashiensis]GIJ03265.1 6-phosphogluconolactonase [Spirilliplanes yamanashiensis]
MTETSVVVHADAGVLASAVAARLIVKIIDAQAERGWASVVLTGGRIAAAMQRAVLELPARDAVDWSRVDLWWGDERFLPAGHADRNETQAREALLDKLPLDPARVHAMPPSDGPDGDDPDAAAARYAAALAAAAKPGHAELPHFDVLMLGVGEDGHVASIFPEHPTAYVVDGTTMAVRNSPKPPPTRVSLTMPAITTAEEVWLIAAGADKAASVGMAIEGAGPVQLPAAGATGVDRTLWLLDQAAAAHVKRGHRSLR